MRHLVDITLPIRTQNPLNMQTGNTKVAAIIRTRKRAKERAFTYMALAGRTPKARDLPYAKYIVTLTRMSSKRMDDEGFIASAKGIRDATAEALGLDDGDTERIEFKYPQVKCPRGSYGVRIQIDAEDGKDSSQMTTVQVAEREIDKTESQEVEDEETPAVTAAAESSKDTNGHTPKPSSPRAPRKAPARAAAPSTDGHDQGADKVSYVETVKARRMQLIREIQEQIETKNAEREALDDDLEALEEELTSMTGGPAPELRTTRPRGPRPSARMGMAPTKARAKATLELPRLKRRTVDEIKEQLGKVVALVSRTKNGMRSEEIREALKLDVREMPMVLKMGIELRKLKAKGERRATTYFASR